MTRDEHAAQAQRALWPLVSKLQEVEDVLDLILAEMPDASEDMLCCAHVPPDFMLEVEGGMYFILNDDLRPLIAGLKRLAALTHADLARHQEVVRLRQVN